MSEVAFEPLTAENCEEVHAFCERETQFWSVSINDFRRFMLRDPAFLPELTLVARAVARLWASLRRHPGSGSSASG